MTKIILFILIITLLILIWNNKNKKIENFENINKIKFISNKKIIYLTSFNQKLYDLSGCYLIDSFKKYLPNEKLVICYENTKFQKTHNEKNLLKYNLSNNSYLNHWLEKNQDIIPEKFGGINKKKMSYWNNRSSLWFRKVASINYVYKNLGYKYDLIVWLDCDLKIKNKNLSSLIRDNIKDNDVLYLYGKKRLENKNLSIETGFLVFKKNKDDYKPIKYFVNEYNNKNKLRKYKRWDDGYIFEMVLKNNNDIKGLDLVKNSFDYNNPINDTIFSKTLIHNKGLHNKSINF